VNSDAVTSAGTVDPTGSDSELPPPSFTKNLLAKFQSLQQSEEIVKDQHGAVVDSKPKKLWETETASSGTAETQANGARTAQHEIVNAVEQDVVDKSESTVKVSEVAVELATSSLMEPAVESEVVEVVGTVEKVEVEDPSAELDEDLRMRGEGEGDVEEGETEVLVKEDVVNVPAMCEEKKEESVSEAHELVEVEEDEVRDEQAVVEHEEIGAESCAEVENGEKDLEVDQNQEEMLQIAEEETRTEDDGTEVHVEATEETGQGEKDDDGEEVDEATEDGEDKQNSLETVQREERIVLSPSEDTANVGEDVTSTTVPEYEEDGLV
jgi:hypothetical protein